MVRTITARNVNSALEEALWLIKEGAWTTQDTRNGRAYVLPGPLVTTFRHPEERVLFWPLRDANPFFHVFEAIWMLAGREDVRWPAKFVKRFKNFSDDGVTLHGAYGHRWRHHFGRDQISDLIGLLRDTPNTRRAVLQMWDGNYDLGSSSQDLPCNLSVVFDIRRGALHAYVMNRSNDIIWGLYGANAVHFSFLQEYIAAALGLPMGKLTIFSTNAHAYTWLSKLDEMIKNPQRVDYYEQRGFSTVPICSGKTGPWLRDAERFLGNPDTAPNRYSETFFRTVAAPMYAAWRHHQKGDTEKGMQAVNMVMSPDWRLAGYEWLKRRAKAKEEA